MSIELKHGAIIILAVFLLFLLVSRYNESFNSLQYDLDHTQYNDYGLRGEPHAKSCIHDKYISHKRHIRLNNSGGDMWVSSNSPDKFGMQNCQMVGCPPGDGYDKLDTCWQCDSGMKFPDNWQ